MASAILAAVCVAQGRSATVELHSARARRSYEIAEYWFTPTILFPTLAAGRADRGDRAGAHAALDEWDATQGRRSRRYRPLVDLFTGAPEAARVPRSDPVPPLHESNRAGLAGGQCRRRASRDRRADGDARSRARPARHPVRAVRARDAVHLGLADLPPARDRAGAERARSGRRGEDLVRPRAGGCDRSRRDRRDRANRPRPRVDTRRRRCRRHRSRPCRPRRVRHDLHRPEDVGLGVARAIDEPGRTGRASRDVAWHAHRPRHRPRRLDATQRRARRRHLPRVAAPS